MKTETIILIGAAAAAALFLTQQQSQPETIFGGSGDGGAGNNPNPTNITINLDAPTQTERSTGPAATSSTSSTKKTTTLSVGQSAVNSYLNDRASPALKNSVIYTPLPTLSTQPSIANPWGGSNTAASVAGVPASAVQPSTKKQTTQIPIIGKLPSLTGK